MIEFFFGIILGAVFFGGLYLTVRRLNEVKNPSALFVISFMVRMAVLLGGLFYVSRWGYRGVLLALLGMIATRYIMIFYIKNPRPEQGEEG